MNFFQQSKLSDVAGVEQDLATGETVDGSVPKKIEINMIPLLDDPNIS
jgi:syntaxin-binding protein 1